MLTIYLDSLGACIGGTVEVVTPLDCSPLDHLRGRTPTKATHAHAFPVFHALAALVEHQGGVGGSSEATSQGLAPTVPRAQAHWLLASPRLAAARALAQRGGLSSSGNLADPELAAATRAHGEAAQHALAHTVSLLAAVELTVEDQQAVVELATAVFFLARGAPHAVVAELLGLPTHTLEAALAEAAPHDSSSSGGLTPRGGSLRRTGSASPNRSEHGVSSGQGAALARVLHRTLFDWLVGCANAASRPTPDAPGFRTGRTVRGTARHNAF